MAYRRIAPSIMKKASAEADVTSGLYDVQEEIIDANKYVKQAGKYTGSARKSKYTGVLLKELNMRKEIAEKEDQDYSSALFAMEMLSGWRLQGKDWYSDIMGIQGSPKFSNNDSSTNLGSSYSNLGTLTNRRTY